MKFMFLCFLYHGRNYYYEAIVDIDSQVFPLNRSCDLLSTEGPSHIDNISPNIQTYEHVQSLPLFDNIFEISGINQ